MKRFLSFFTVLCLLLSCVSVASAAVSITQQPTDQTVKAGGKVTFTVKVSGNIDTLTWYFTNPATGDQVTGKKLPNAVKGVKVSSPNSKKITITKVPASMHGWTVYCMINKKVQSDTVRILIEGMPDPDGAAADEAPAASPTDIQGASSPTDIQGASSPTDMEGSTSEAVDEPMDEPADEPASEVSTPEPAPVVTEAPPEPIVITSSSSKVELYAVDSKGKLTGAATSELTFDPGTTANFYVKLAEGTEGSIQYITLNDVRLTPEGEVTGMSVRGWNTSAAVKVKIGTGDSDEGDGGAPAPRARAEVSTEGLDTSNLATITCVNCRFNGYNIKNAESGQVPVGSTITVYATGGLINNGYTINGGKRGVLLAENVVGGSEKNISTKGMASFQMVVTGDTTIEIDKQPVKNVSSD